MTAPLFVACAATGVLAVAAAIDLRRRVVPDSLSITLLALALSSAIFGWQDVDLASMAIGLVVGFTVGFLGFRYGSLGGGDGKLLAALGALCGWPSVVELLFTTALCGGLCAGVARCRGERSFAYAPAIALAFVLTAGAQLAEPGSHGLWHAMTGRPLC